jgi:hypothetical protein
VQDDRGDHGEHGGVDDRARAREPIGPIYTRAEADALATAKGWTFKPDGNSFRRVVPSPVPRRIFGIEPVKWMLDRGCVVICAGDGGITVMYTDEPVTAGRRLVGVEAVIDKDLASALLAVDLGADALAIVTGVDAVYLGWGTPDQRAIRRASPDAFASTEFAAGSMGPKVRAACQFVEETGGIAAIGSIHDTADLLRGAARLVASVVQELHAVAQDDLGGVLGRHHARRRDGRRGGGDADVVDELVEAAGGEDPDHAGAGGADGEAVRDVAGPVGVLAGAELDGLVADLDRDGPIEDVEALVVAVVDVERGLEAGGSGDLEERVHAVGVGGGGLDFGEHAEEPVLLAAGGRRQGLGRCVGCHAVPPCGAGAGDLGRATSPTIIRRRVFVK